jgi:uncharacterized membrane protein YGL010W
MKTGVDQLTKYAAYHRDRRNIMTHFFGIPLIVFAALVLMSRVYLFSVNDAAVSLAAVVWVLSSVYYLKLDLMLGALITLIHGAMLIAAAPFGQASTQVWLAMGVGVFVFGWVLQFIGHYYEGKKPAFVDDLIGLAIGPFFVLAELVFLLGLRKPLQAAIEAQVGPTLIRQKTIA